MTLNEFMKKASGQVPWYRYNWSGKFLSFDDTPTHEFEEKDLDKVFAVENSGPDWDGDAAAVVLLKDGRWAAWESNWGPTGFGFSAIPYGGYANVYFAKTLFDVIRLGLSIEAKEMLNIDIDNLDLSKLEPITKE